LQVGIDANTISSGAAASLRETLEEKKIHLECVEDNLVDAAWGSERPAMPDAKLRVHSLHYAGVSVTDKLIALRGAMREAGCSVLIASSLDEIAWMLNVRGGDIAHCPVTYGYALVEMGAAVLYCDVRKVTAEVAAHLKAANVEVRPYKLNVAKNDAMEALKQAGGMVRPNSVTLVSH
jgi:Xaa-Pro aminopeptidase